MTYAKDPRVNAYLDGLADWQQAICRDVRNRQIIAGNRAGGWRTLKQASEQAGEPHA